MDDIDAGLITMSFRKQSPEQKLVTTWPTLRVIAGADMLAYLTVTDEGPFTIGRDVGCDLQLVDNSVSRMHVEVTRDDDDHVYIRDLGSTNGTTRNSRRVVGRVRLVNNDTIGIGAVVLRYEKLGSDEVEHLEQVRRRLDLANRDPLTGLWTRNYLLHEAPARLRRSLRLSRPVCGLFIDVDDFKHINDTYGHVAGDDVLRTVSKILYMHLRDSDVCVRYGGEEFFAILDGADEETGARTAERLRQRVEEHNWELHVPDMKVTVSIGVAELTSVEDLEAWIGRADRAMYASKAGGKNQVTKAADFE